MSKKMKLLTFVMCLLICISCSKNLQIPAFTDHSNEPSQIVRSSVIPSIDELEHLPTRVTADSSGFNILGKDAIIVSKNCTINKDSTLGLNTGDKHDFPAFAIYKIGPFPKNDAPVNGGLTINNIWSTTYFYVGYPDFSKRIWKWNDEQRVSWIDEQRVSMLDFGISASSVSATGYTYLAIVVTSSATINNINVTRWSENPVNWNMRYVQIEQLSPTITSNIISINGKPGYCFIDTSTSKSILKLVKALKTEPQTNEDWEISTIDDNQNILSVKPNMISINDNPYCVYMDNNNGLQFAYLNSSTLHSKLEWNKHSIGLKINKYNKQQFELTEINHFPSVYIITSTGNLYLLTSTTLTPKSLEDWNLNLISLNTVHTLKAINNLENPAVLFTKTSDNRHLYFSQSKVSQPSVKSDWNDPYSICSASWISNISSKVINSRIYICYLKQDSTYYIEYAYSNNLNPKTKDDWTFGKIDNYVNSSEQNLTITSNNNLPFISFVDSSNDHLVLKQSMVDTPLQNTDWNTTDLTDYYQKYGRNLFPLSLATGEINGKTVAVTILPFGFFITIDWYDSYYLYQWEPKTY